ncbi:hypothetical protein GOBAR_AA29113 [Gossypium barbadense]|uniref:Uncharacterized protein n=1 Tax=Gossypium barbadense TaxID=3634 RepID=A0A2P5WKF5_GOSBA|nr:hypothetical protein GOBAR_AA29113 [Gossypium barbadense]
MGRGVEEAEVSGKARHVGANGDHSLLMPFDLMANGESNEVGQLEESGAKAFQHKEGEMWILRGSAFMSSSYINSSV